MPRRGPRAAAKADRQQEEGRIPEGVEEQGLPPGIASFLHAVAEEDDDEEAFLECVGRDIIADLLGTPELDLPPPPGLRPPPGLGEGSPGGGTALHRAFPQVAAKPPCAWTGAAPTPTFYVRIQGLPNELLAKCMMEVVLQQAGLNDTVVSCAFKESAPCGQALIGFTSSRAALRCAAHFHGCQWDRSGVEVATEAFEAGGKGCPLTGRSAQELLAVPQGCSLPLDGDFPVCNERPAADDVQSGAPLPKQELPWMTSSEPRTGTLPFSAVHAALEPEDPSMMMQPRAGPPRFGAEAGLGAHWAPEDASGGWPAAAQHGSRWGAASQPSRMVRI